MAYCIQVLCVLCQAPTLNIMATLVHGNVDLDDIDGTKGRLLLRAIYVYFILMAARIQPGMMDSDSCLSPQLSMSWTKYDTSIHPSHQYTLDKFFAVISYLYLHFILPKCDSGLSNISKSTQPDMLTGGGVQIFDRYLTPNIS